PRRSISASSRLPRPAVRAAEFPTMKIRAVTIFVRRSKKIAGPGFSAGWRPCIEATARFGLPVRCRLPSTILIVRLSNPSELDSSQDLIYLRFSSVSHDVHDIVQQAHLVVALFIDLR